MRILVTGGAGFIGSNLCRLLLSEGVEPVVVDDASGGINYLPEGVERHTLSVADLMEQQDASLAGLRSRVGPMVDESAISE